MDTEIVVAVTETDPAGRACGWCGAMFVPTEDERQLYCKPGHRVKAKRAKQTARLRRAYRTPERVRQAKANCRGKITYRSRAEAGRAGRVFNDRREGVLIPYRCVVCGGWHLTSHRPRLSARAN